MKIAFTFIVKDGGRYLERNLERIKKFNQDIYAVENNSTDNTKTILNNSNIKNVLCLDLGDERFSSSLCKGRRNCLKRIRRIAYLRQKVLDSVLNSGINYDYICMLDMDFLDFNSDHLKNIFEHMEKTRDIDGMFGMSFATHYLNIPYDIGAVKPLYKIPQIGLKFSRYVQVSSAFSGFGIYRYSSILNKKAGYDIKYIDDIEHIYFNSHFDKLIVDTHFNPSYKISKRGKRELTTDVFISLSVLIFIIIIIYLLYRR